MNILITGGAGFLGGHLASFLKEKKHNITLLDLHTCNLEECSKENNLLQIDVRDKDKLQKVISRQEVIIHAAAALPLWKKEDIYSTNIEGTENVLEAALKHGIKRVIYISSTAVYGVPKKHPIEEDDPLIGVGHYGISKIRAERTCNSYLNKGLNVTVLRPKTFLGTGRLGIFEILFDWIHDGKKIPVIGSGKNKYQLLDVDDLVEVVYLLILNDKKEHNNIFNIAAKQFGTVKEDMKNLFTFAQSGSSLLATPAWLVKGSLRILDLLRLSPLYQWIYETADKDSYVSTKKAEEILHWFPKYSNTQTLIKSYKWYLENYDHIKSKSSGVTHTAAWQQGVIGWIKKLM